MSDGTKPLPKPMCLITRAWSMWWWQDYIIVTARWTMNWCNTNYFVDHSLNYHRNQNGYITSWHTVYDIEYGCIYFTLFCFYHTILVQCQSLQWRHSERDDVLNHRRLDCLLNRLFRCRSKKASNRLVFVRETTGERWFPSQRASNAENVSIWWRHHESDAG